MDIEATFAEAKAQGIVGPGYVGTFADIVSELHSYHPDEDGEKAWLRYVEGGWHGGNYDER